MSKSQNGYLFIADITGYTMFLSESELEHAQGVLTSLLELLIGHTRPPLVISRLAGDAVISYGIEGTFFQGQTFVEVIEDTYVAFRKSIDRMVLNNSCRCNACANVASLDLKFFVHYGTFVVQKLGAHDELVGNDVNLIHRLLKNSVTERTGVRAYALYTDAAIRQLGIEEATAPMKPHAESYEHLGEVKVWVQDLRHAWDSKRSAAQMTLAPQDVLFRLETEIAAPAHVVWDYLASPEHRKVLLGADRQSVTNRMNGRVGEGAVYQCFHGDKVIPQTVLEWQPFERVLTDSLLPPPFRNTTILVDCRLAASSGGTRLEQVFGKPKGPWLDRTAASLSIRMSRKASRRDMDAFKAHVEKDLTSRGGLPEASTTSPAAVTEAVVASLSSP